MMVRLLVLAACFAFGLSAAAHAADDDQDTRLAAARQMMTAGHDQDMQRVRIELIVARAQIQLREMRPGIPPGAVDHYGQVLREELTRDRARLDELKARYYADHYTAADLKAWTAMLNSDIGQKIIASEPGIMKDLYGVDELWVENAMTRTQARLAAESDGG